MNTLRSIILFFSSITMAFVLSGCSSPPKEEEKSAKDAIQAAQNAEAPTYAAQEWNDADAAYRGAEAKMQNKDYNEAKTLFTAALEKAGMAKLAAERNKAELAKELTKSKESTLAAIAHAKSELDKRRKTVTKVAAGNVEAMIKEAEQGLDAANNSIASGKLNEAKETLAAASGKVESATSALATAVASKHTKPAAKVHATSGTTKHSKPVATGHAKHTQHKKK
jgi:hypothetical protein